MEEFVLLKIFNDDGQPTKAQKIKLYGVPL